jgi:hypothetical protein
MTHLDIYNTSYGEKKGRESNHQFESQPLKARNRPKFFTCKCFATYHWNAFDDGYNFASNVISIGGVHTKLWGPKLQESQLWDFGTPIWESQDKMPFGCGPHEEAQSIL